MAARLDDLSAVTLRCPAQFPAADRGHL